MRADWALILAWLFTGNGYVNILVLHSPGWALLNLFVAIGYWWLGRSDGQASKTPS